MSVAASTPAPARRAGRFTPRKVVSRTGLFLLMAAFIIASLFPFYWIVATSLKTDQATSLGTTSLLPGTHLTFRAYTFDLTQTGATGLSFGRALINSLIVALAATAITLIVSVLAGYALARTQIRGKASILGFVLLASFFPPLAMVGPMFLAYRHLGLINSYPALIITYLIYTLPLATWFLANFFSQLPLQLEEAAAVDGASRLQTLWRVILPIAVPGIFTTAILAFILAWNDFAFAVSFMETPDKYTAPLAIVALSHSQYQVFYNRLDAAVVMVTIPIALLVIFAQRRIISGLTAGALK